MLPWLLFSDTVQRSSSSLVEQASLITKTIFPAEMVPLSVFLSSLVSHLLALVLMLVATEIKVRSLGLPLAILPLYMLLLGLLAVGIGWVVAALQVYLRDTAQFVTVILTAWFWMTPIFIFEDQVPTGGCGSWFMPIRWRAWCARTGKCCFRRGCRVGGTPHRWPWSV